MGYTSLVGADSESYGWDLGKNQTVYCAPLDQPTLSARNLCNHNLMRNDSWPYPTEEYVGREDFRVPDKFFCILDMDEGTLAFATPSQYLGVAFCNLKNKKLYPIISAVWGKYLASSIINHRLYLGAIRPL